MKLEVYDVMYALNDVSDYLVMETAEKSRQLRERIVIKWASLAACVCLLCTAAVYSLYMSGAIPHTPPAGTVAEESSGTADTDDTDEAVTVTLITPPSKTEYLLGESPDLSGLSLGVTFGDGTTRTVSDGFTCGTEIFEEVGRVEIAVGIGGAYVKLPVNVREPEVAEISVETLPERTTFTVYSSVDPAGLSLRVTYKNGYVGTVDYGYTHDGINFQDPGDATVNIGYRGASTSFTVKVVENDIVSAAVITRPSKTEYVFGERIDTSGLTLKVTHSDGTTETVSDGFNLYDKYASDIGENQIVVANYNGLPFTFYITVQEMDTVGTIASGRCGEDVTWTLDSTGALTVSGTGEMWSAENMWLPLCDYHNVVRSITVDAGITDIGDYMFEDEENVSSLIIAPSVKTIGISAFSFLFKLSSVTIPDGVETISEYAFRGCESLTSVSIPGSVEYIGYDAFSTCTSLTSVTLPEGVEYIDDRAFYMCTSLSSVQLPESIEWVGGGIFESCSSLKSVTFPRGVDVLNMPFGGDSGIEDAEAVYIEDVYIENANCEIYGGEKALGIPGVTTVHGRAGSTAEEYANMYGYRFEPIE